MNPNDIITELWEGFYPPMDIQDAKEEVNRIIYDKGTTTDEIVGEMDKVLNQDKSLKGMMKLLHYKLLTNATDDFLPEEGIPKIIDINLRIQGDGSYSNIFSLAGMWLRGLVISKKLCALMEEKYNEALQYYAEQGQGKLRLWAMALKQEYILAEAYYRKNMEDIVTKQAELVINEKF